MQLDRVRIRQIFLGQKQPERILEQPLLSPVAEIPMDLCRLKLLLAPRRQVLSGRALSPLHGPGMQ